MRRAAGWRFALRTEESGAIVLCHHRVDNGGPGLRRLCLSPQAFRDEVTTLQATCDVVTLRAAVALSRAGEASPRTVALTFDDGYEDNLRVAAPVLREFDMPATFFVTTDGLLSTQPFEYWWDRVERLVTAGADWPSELRLTIAGVERCYLTATAGERLRAHDEISAKLFLAPAAERDLMLNHLAMWRGSSAPAICARRMTAFEVRELAVDSRFEIAAHSVSHARLVNLPSDELATELVESKRVLEQLVHKPVTAFAYPFGQTNDVVAAAARDAGYEAAFTTESRPLAPGDSQWSLPRVDTSVAGFGASRGASAFTLP